MRNGNMFLKNLAPLPQNGSVYLFCKEWNNSYTELNERHPEPLGTVAFLPVTEYIDTEVASKTVGKIFDEWMGWRTR